MANEVLTSLKGIVDSVVGLGKELATGKWTDPNSPFNGGQNLVFPPELKTTKNYPCIQFTVKDTRSAVQNSYNIFLPMVSGLAFDDEAQFEGTALNQMGMIGMQAGRAGSLEAALKAAPGIIANALPNNNAELAANASGMLGNDFQAGVGIALGVVPNKNINTAFEGIGTRTHTFEFKLLGKTAAENEVIRKIQSAFRLGVYPESTQVSQYRPPAWTIRFINASTGEHLKHVPKAYECYLKSVKASFNNESDIWREDNAPLDVKLCVSFIETKALSVYDIMELEKNGGFTPTSHRNPIERSASVNDATKNVGKTFMQTFEAFGNAGKSLLEPSAANTHDIPAEFR